MINDIVVLDDIFSKAYQDSIEATIMKNTEFPWYYSPSLSKPIANAVDNNSDSPGWAHVFFHRSTGPSSFVANILMPVAQEAFGKINLYTEEFIQGRIFQLLSKNSSQTEIPPWHVDMADMQHMVCLYYVNDSTGPTFISSQRFDPRFDQMIENAELPVEKTVEPKKGRVVLFDGSRYHRASNPENGRRVVINFNARVTRI